MVVPPKHSLTEGSIAPALLAFSLPILFGNVLQSINGSVNAVWVGKYLGEAALAAVGNANVVMFLLFGVLFGLSMASTIMVAQCVGAKNIGEAKRVVGTSAVFFLGLSLLMSLMGFALTQFLVDWLRTPPDALPFALIYMRIIFLALPFMGGLFFLMAVLRGAGDSRTPFIYLVMAVALDIALNPLLIFGWGPVPRLGDGGLRDRHLDRSGREFFCLGGAPVPNQALPLHSPQRTSPVRGRLVAGAAARREGHSHGAANVRGLLQHDCADVPGESIRFAGDRGLQRRNAAVELRADARARDRRRRLLDGRTECRRGKMGSGGQGRRRWQCRSISRSSEY